MKYRTLEQVAAHNVKMRHVMKKIAEGIAVTAFAILISCGPSDAATVGHQRMAQAPKYNIRDQKAVVLQAKTIKGTETDCENCWNKKHVQYVKVKTISDGEIWIFYAEPGKYGFKKGERCRVSIYNNGTKTKLDDEITAANHYHFIYR